MNKINCFISYSSPGFWDETLAELRSSQLVNRIFLLGQEQDGKLPEGCEFIRTDGSFSTNTIRKISDHSHGAAYTLLITRESRIRFGMLALERFVDLADGSGAPVLYSDYFDRIEAKLSAHPVIDYQAGSLRDDFEFGPVLFLNSQALRQATGALRESLLFAGLYQLRLKLSQSVLPLRIPEYLYSVEPFDTSRVPSEIGCLYYSARRQEFVDPQNVPDAVPHFGRPGGVLPRIVDARI